MLDFNLTKRLENNYMGLEGTCFLGYRSGDEDKVRKDGLAVMA